MRTVKIQSLTTEAFREYGFFADLLSPDKYFKDGGSRKFFRELAILNLGDETNAAFSTLNVQKRKMVVDATEYHSHCGEGMFPVDGDVIMHVGPGTTGEDVSLDKMEAFLVPKGTFIALRPGTWHYEPFAYGSDLVHVLIVLPERAYATDTCFVELPESECFQLLME